MSKHDLEWTLEMVGPDLPDALAFDLIIDYDFRAGSPMCWEHPGDPDEIEITRVAIGAYVGPGLYDWRFDELCLLPVEYERVTTHISENPPDDDYPDDDYDPGDD